MFVNKLFTSINAINLFGDVDFTMLKNWSVEFNINAFGIYLLIIAFILWPVLYIYGMEFAI